jgi:hypothetical protein
MSLFSRFFRNRPTPPKTVDDHLHDVEERLVKELAQLAEPGSSEAWSKEDINTCLLSLEKIDEIQERRRSRKDKSFFHTPAGASVLTAIITITATQIPAMLQLFTAQEAEATKRLTPVIEAVAKDGKFNLGEKLAVIDFVSSHHYRFETVEQFLDGYRSEIRYRANERRRSTESRIKNGPTEQANPNNQLNKDTSR